MSKPLDGNEHKTRTIHPRAISEIGEAACIAALEVARMFKDGTIPPERYDQMIFTSIGSTPSCGSAHCIAGWIAEILNDKTFIGTATAILSLLTKHQDHLFSAAPLRVAHQRQPTVDEMIAAVHRYVYEGYEKPWQQV